MVMSKINMFTILGFPKDICSKFDNHQFKKYTEMTCIGQIAFDSVKTI
jgi:hypothetical protein